MQLAIIGAGNIGNAIVNGLIKSKSIKASELIVSDIDKNSLELIKKIDA